MKNEKVDAVRDARGDKMYACVRLHIYLYACARVCMIYAGKRKLSYAFLQQFRSCAVNYCKLFYD